MICVIGHTKKKITSKYLTQIKEFKQMENERSSSESESKSKSECKADYNGLCSHAMLCFVFQTKNKNSHVAWDTQLCNRRFMIFFFSLKLHFEITHDFAHFFVSLQQNTSYRTISICLLDVCVRVCVYTRVFVCWYICVYLLQKFSYDNSTNQECSP